MIPIFEPYFHGNEKDYLMECIETSWISSQGEYIVKFENALASYHDMKHAIVTSNCTTALHLSLKGLGIGKGDEVICPDLTFIAPANMVVLSGAKLVLVDIDPETLTIDPYQIEKKITKNTKAIIVVHQFGHASHMEEISSISKNYGLKIIEDNAESLGGRYKGKLLGTFGDISTFSFFGNKIITTGEGGALLTNNKEVAKKCRELRDHGMQTDKKYHHIDLGYNYRMTNMQAAIGLAQMEVLNEILKKRKEQMDIYYEELFGVKDIHLRKFQDWCDPVHWMLTITLKNGFNRDELIKKLKNHHIDSRQMVNPVHYAEHFKHQFNNEKFPNSESISKMSMHLPSGTGLTKEEIKFISTTFKDFLN